MSDPYNIFRPDLTADDAASIVERYSRLRVSRHFTMRDFLWSSWSAVRVDKINYPDRPSYCYEAIRHYAEHILEPIWAQFGPLKITYGYSSKDRYEKGEVGEKNKSPHYWDRGTFGDQYYVRTDFSILAVADKLIDRDEAALWIMNNLDVDLLMQFAKGPSIYCLTISPKPRRVWLEWVPWGKGDPSQKDGKGTNKITKWGENFWQNVYPTLPESERPAFGPSQTDGKMYWGKK